MSHPHHHDEETEMVNMHNSGDNTIPRRHSHTHLHLKPTAVFDHIKTKVKRKRASHTEIPAFATNSPTCGDNIPKRTNGLEVKTTLTTSHSQPVSSIPHSSDNNHENKNSNERPTIVLDHEDTGLVESVQFRLNPVESDAENNQPKTTKSKAKSHKPNKSPPELTVKRHRQSARRSGFQIHDGDFNSIFYELPADEQLIVAYPCAWRKDIFMHGRMFLSVNYLCFYTCFFKWEESLCIAYKDIVSVKREKSEKSLPNAIQIRTKNREHYVFASYIPRERIFIAINRLWQNALHEKSLDYQQLRTIVYAHQTSIDESTGDSEESVTLENSDEHFRNLSQSLPAIGPKRARELTRIPSDDGSYSSSPADPTTYVSACPCETHLARTYADRVFSYHVDRLFELIFGNNSFTRAFHDSQKLIDYTIGEWRRNPETGKRERQVTYKTVTQSILGTNMISCTEKQIIEAEKPRSMYVVNTEVYNEGMKYTDAFFVATRFCMFQRSGKQSSLRVSAEVKYVKNVNGIAKAFIEKNCNSNIEDGVNNQMRRLENNQPTVKHGKSDEDQTPKRRSQKQKSDDHDQTITKDIPSENLGKTITGKGLFADMALFIGIFILLLHLYLCYKLYSIDSALYNPGNTCINQCKKDCLSSKFSSRDF